MSPRANTNFFSLGIALAQPPLIQILSNTKAPYNISTPTAHLALSALSPESVARMQSVVRGLVAGRATLIAGLRELAPLGVGPAIGANDANFVVVPILTRPTGADGAQGAPDSARAHAVYKTLAEERAVVVRFRGNEPGCAGCLRITVGTEVENAEVLAKLRVVLGEM